VGEHGIEFAPLEETGSRVVLLEHVDVGPAYDPADLLAKPEHALERGELPVDGSVRGRVLLPVPDIGEVRSVEIACARHPAKNSLRWLTASSMRSSDLRPLARYSSSRRLARSSKRV